MCLCLLVQKRGNMDADGDDDGEGLADLGETLEAKVKALGLDGGAGGGAGEGLGPGKLKASSVDAVLRQALDSDDKTLLQQCLGVSDDKVIVATVARLQPKHVTPLLRKVLERRRCLCVCVCVCVCVIYA